MVEIDEKLSEFLQLAPSKKVSPSSRFFHFLEEREEAETIASNNNCKNGAWSGPRPRPSGSVLERSQSKTKSKLPSSSGDHCQYFKRKISCSLFELLPDGDGVGNLVVQEAVNKVEDKTVVSEAEITNADISDNRFKSKVEYGCEGGHDRHQELLELFSKAIPALKAAGLINDFCKFFKLVALGNFPLTNISLLLFLDTVNLYSCDNACGMRHREETLLFWLFGYLCFHGKWLRFARVLKFSGSAVNNRARLGHFNMIDASVFSP